MKKEVLMFKDGQWIKWDGSDIKSLLVKEQITLKQLKKYYPEQYKKLTPTLLKGEGKI
jgi:hypothetical protein